MCSITVAMSCWLLQLCNGNEYAFIDQADMKKAWYNKRDRNMSGASVSDSTTSTSAVTRGRSLQSRVLEDGSASNSSAFDARAVDTPRIVYPRGVERNSQRKEGTGYIGTRGRGRGILALSGDAWSGKSVGSVSSSKSQSFHSSRLSNPIR